MIGDRQLDDQELWARIANDDHDAFGVLFDRHMKAIYGYALRKSLDATVAEDVVAMTFLEAWRKRRRVVLSSPTARPWLFGVANNMLRNQRRSSQRYEAALQRLAGTRSEPISPEDDWAKGTDLDEQSRAVAAAFGRLPRGQRDVAWLCLVEELSYADAAGALGVAVGTVRSRLSRARATLQSDPSLEPFWADGHVSDEEPT